MKTAVKTIVILFLFLVLFPTLAGLAVTALWNGIMPAVCGFAVITFWQGVGMFALGQILTGGVLIAIFLCLGGLHAISHHRGEWHSHWHNMTPEQRREFIERRRREHFGFTNRTNPGKDAAQ